ncbi:MAG TPA: chaperone modulator CbpM [Solirubrobacteraceae bacterium]
MAIAASNRRTVDNVAREAGMHPDLVRRYVAFGLIDEPFPVDAAARVAKAQRLRRDLALNLAGAVLAVELLRRIDDLEARLRRYER